MFDCLKLQAAAEGIGRRENGRYFKLTNEPCLSKRETVNEKQRDSKSKKDDGTEKHQERVLPRGMAHLAAKPAPKIAAIGLLFATAIRKGASAGIK